MSLGVPESLEPRRRAWAWQLGLSQTPVWQGGTGLGPALSLSVWPSWLWRTLSALSNFKWLLGSFSGEDGRVSKAGMFTQQSEGIRGCVCVSYVCSSHFTFRTKLIVGHNRGVYEFSGSLKVEVGNGEANLPSPHLAT